MNAGLLVRVIKYKVSSVSGVHRLERLSLPVRRALVCLLAWLELELLEASLSLALNGT